MPSREFMIRQAVLNYLARQLPNSLSAYGAGGALLYIRGLWDNWPREIETSSIVFSGIRAEYNQLVNREQLCEIDSANA